MSDCWEMFFRDISKPGVGGREISLLRGGGFLLSPVLSTAHFPKVKEVGLSGFKLFQITTQMALRVCS